MKRVAEFVLGLIGSIMGILIAIPTFVFMGFMPVTEDLSGVAFVSNIVGAVIAIVAIVFSCLINKFTKLSSIILIIAAVGLLLTNFFQVIPFILLLVAGILGLVREA